MHLYYLFSERSDWSALDEELLAYVSEERRQKINSYRFVKDKKLSLYAGLLLPYACSDQFDLSFQEIDPLWPPKKKPVLNSHPEIHFSLAHSGTCVAIALSEAVIGLDLELVQEAPLRILKRAFSHEEAERIEHADDSNLEFYRCWTQKEAYGKYLGTGMSTHVLKSNTYSTEHQSCIAGGILTDEDVFSHAEYRSHLKASSPLSSAVYSFSVYGSDLPPELIRVDWKDLLEYYLLCI